MLGSQAQTRAPYRAGCGDSKLQVHHQGVFFEFVRSCVTKWERNEPGIQNSRSKG